MKLGDTFYYEHLWVVASVPGDDGSVVAVNFTSWRQGCDENCLISVGEHPFIKKPTVVAYEKAKLWNTAQQAYIEANPTQCPPHQPVSRSLLDRIQQGALTSDLTTQKVQRIILESLKRQGRVVGS